MANQFVLNNILFSSRGKFWHFELALRESTSLISLFKSTHSVNFASPLLLLLHGLSRFVHFMNLESSHVVLDPGTRAAASGPQLRVHQVEEIEADVRAACWAGNTGGAGLQTRVCLLHWHIAPWFVCFLLSLIFYRLVLFAKSFSLIMICVC